MRPLPLLLSAALIAITVPTVVQAADPKVPAPAAAAAPMPAPGAAATTPDAKSLFTDAQRAEIESIIKDYISKKNPSVLMDGLQELQKEQAADASAKSKTALTTDHAKVFDDPTAPIGGNPKGDVTLVEFFDYQCGYCKLAEPGVEKLLKEDKNLKLVYKEYPILGPTSVTASKAALASVRQGKYDKFHDALMNAQFSHGAKPQEDEDMIYKTAKTVGLDVDKLKKDMKDDAIDKIVEANVALGPEIGARGTPTFIVDDNVYPGAMEYDALKKIIDDARTADKAAPKKP